MSSKKSSDGAVIIFLMLGWAMAITFAQGTIAYQQEDYYITLACILVFIFMVIYLTKQIKYYYG